MPAVADAVRATRVVGARALQVEQVLGTKAAQVQAEQVFGARALRAERVLGALVRVERAVQTARVRAPQAARAQRLWTASLLLPSAVRRLAGRRS